MPENVLSNNSVVWKDKLKDFGSEPNLIDEVSWHFIEETGENQETLQL